jgi:predicted RNase H-like HicB family nuclease
MPSGKSATKKKPKASDYQIVVFWSDDDHCFLAEAPALAGSMTHGATPQEAFENGLDSAQSWIDAAYKHGHHIPEPQRRFSGQLNLRLPISLHEKLSRLAEREHVSLNQLLLSRISGDR